MFKCEIRKQLIREVEKLDELKKYKFYEDNLRKQQTRHIKIIKIKIKELSEELKK